MKAILMLDEMPKSCADCYFKINADRKIWRCGIIKNKRNLPEYVGKEKYIEYVRYSKCPLIEINDNIAKLIEVAR